MERDRGGSSSMTRGMAGEVGATRCYRRASWMGAPMDTGNAVDLVRETLVLALTVSAPMLLCGLVVGILVSLLQAVTQIQEQTLTFVPKIAAMVVAAILLMPWISHRVVEYATAMFSFA